MQFGDPVKPSTVRAGEGFTGIGLPEKDIFYFHPDHLGSTSYISSGNGSISQHVEYIAFGEVLFEEHSSSFSSPYLFNGKELDRETNLSYYGARYLDMKTSLWLSVDPKKEDYIFAGPYIFCMNNPVNIFDPDGNRILFVNGHWNRFLGWLIGSSSPKKEYWEEGFDKAAQTFFGDHSNITTDNYVDGSSLFGGSSSGGEREELGYEYAKKNYKTLTHGMKKGEEFEMVTHSEGGAYGAGIARFLIEKGHTVKQILHLSTDEGDEFSTPEGPETYQLSYKGDWITGNKQINNGTDVFGIIDRFETKSDKFTFAHGSTKSAEIFKSAKVMLESLKKLGGISAPHNYQDQKTKIKFEIILDYRNSN
ncbi:hypothetical protein LPBF_11995 [Flavobacterium crassostreae]|uniref:RHS repeat-associated core domain-containing protein n=1 Tax=Flavobacterium crassostreae TaxID=1763534 RepID=A0A1B9DLA9_9FLAO|nr:RHS repeat-associated core domain-containing protein [Flavobacterium crassostreae]OCB70429.1 hypothetical protein LPBF_11995 [Flavobacterium crassostreae]